MRKDYLQFPEVITKACIIERISKSGCKLVELVINDKWRIIPTDDPDKPFKKRKLKNALDRCEEKSP